MWGRAKSDPASRFRLSQYVKPLEKEGHQVTFVTTTPEGNWRCRARIPSVFFWGYLYLVRFIQVLSVLNLIRKARGYDIVMMNRDILPFVKTPWLEEKLVKHNPNLVFDFDDAIYLNSPERKIGRICEIARIVTVGNSRLKEFALKYSSDVRILPTVADTDAIQPEPQKRTGHFKIGWIGSDDSYEHSFSDGIKAAIREFAVVNSAIIHIMKQTAPNGKDWNGVNMKFIKWSMQQEKELLKELDVGIMPVRDDEFQKAKCGGKIILYMAAGLPIIASPVGVNNEIVNEGKCGLLARNKTGWIEALVKLQEDPNLRAGMGRAARSYCEAKFSVKAALPALISTLNDGWQKRC